MNYVYVAKASFEDDNQPSYPWGNCSDPEEYMMGDLNQDQMLDILDIIMYVNVIVFSIIRPFDVDVISIEMEKTEKLLVLEEGNKIGGWGGEVISQICESSCKLPKTICRIGAEDTPIPASLLLEENVLPSEKIIIKTIKDIFKE